MKRALVLAGLGLVTLALISCGKTTAPADAPADQESSDMARPEASYEGVLDEAGITIYQQGTHRLTLDDGRFLLLESAVINLDPFVGKRVIVTGPVEETVEAGAQIMTVNEIAIIAASEQSSEAASSAGSSMASSQEAASSVASSVAPPPPPPPASSKAPDASSSVAPPPAPPPAASSDSGVQRSAELQARIQKMSVPKPESAWTQQYCSSHNGLRFPVRGDWWYHSFGATTSNLWHVELNSQEIVNLGDGPIAVNLVSGRLPDGRADGSISESAGVVTGVRSWTENRHVEVVGPAELRAGIEYIVRNISTCEQ